MKSLRVGASALLLSLAPAALLAQGAGKAQPPAPAAGMTVTTTTTAPPPGAKQAEIQDFRILPAKPEQDPYQLERLGVTFAQNGDLVRARESFEQAWKVGELPSAPFNLACLDVRQGKTDAAYQQLDRAIAAGFDDDKMLLSDGDLAPIRSSARFQAVLSAARKNAAAGDAAVVRDGTYVAPEGPVAGILLLLHDASSDPLAVANPFLVQARTRGLYVVAPRGPAKAGRKRFGWGSPERATQAVAAAIREARRRAGNLPVAAVGVGRGGMVATYFAATQPGVLAAAGSIGGPFDLAWMRGEGSVSALRSMRIFMGASLGAGAPVLQAIRQGRDGLKAAGVPVVYAEWPGEGTGLPADASRAVADVLGALVGR